MTPSGRSWSLPLALLAALVGGGSAFGAEPEPLPPRPDAPAVAAPDAPAAEPPWTWERLVAEVERTSPLMRAARADLATFEAKLSQAEWAWFPSFKLEGSGTVTPQVTGDALKSETDWGTIGYFLSIKLEMVQPIFTFGKIGALKDAARRGIDVGKAQIEAARWELRVLARKAYEGRMLARELDQILSDGRSWIDKAERRMERLRAEDSDDYDQLEHLRLKTRVADFYVLDAENKLLNVRALQGLRLLLSLPPEAEVRLADEPFEPVSYELQPVERYVAAAMRHEPTLMVARTGARAQRALADAKEAELWPDLALVGEVGLRRANEVDDQPSSFANDPFNGRPAGAAIVLKWNLDVPQRLFRAEEARAKALKVSEQVELQRDLVELKVRQLYQDLENKRSLLEVFRDAQKASQGWLTATWDTYDAGFGNFRDVMDALVQFYSKKFGYLQMVYEHNLLVLELSRAIGYDITRPLPGG
ncbi:MAG: hypothetical protein CVU56_05175 [Deltaproteobacteria bacterium HGW-Deltaproteobacteria-14]|nr:MAG: hypothetical protein CVU56_05175 [Deltaproteobacteria bacterium HGW-Deltaproteobacteria-14]